MKVPRIQGWYAVAFVFVHAQIIVLRCCNHDSPYASFQQGEAYTPVGSVNGNICRKLGYARA